jgi:CheY-like chemotaxis protein
VLVVDDRPDVTASMEYLLRLWGFECRACPGGVEALAAVAGGFAPDAALLDIGMPGMDGWALAGRLRAWAAGRPLLLVALSGYATDADRERSAGAGFDLHLAKPADPGAIRAILDGHAAPRAGPARG